MCCVLFCASFNLLCFFFTLRDSLLLLLSVSYVICFSFFLSLPHCTRSSSCFGLGFWFLFLAFRVFRCCSSGIPPYPLVGLLFTNTNVFGHVALYGSVRALPKLCRLCSHRRSSLCSRTVNRTLTVQESASSQCCICLQYIGRNAATYAMNSGFKYAKFVCYLQNQNSKHKKCRVFKKCIKCLRKYNQLAAQARKTSNMLIY